jgi:MerR family transcriptional regulator, repressor of the yfmOP operon
MTTTPIEETRLDRIERIVEQNTKGMTEFKSEMVEFKSEMVEFKSEMSEFKSEMVAFRADAKKWDERFFQLSRDNLNLSRIVIITAGAAVIFSPFLQTVAPSITAFFNKVLGN